VSHKVDPKKKKRATSIALSIEERAEIAPYLKLRKMSVSGYLRELKDRDKRRMQAHMKKLLRAQKKK